ncbi:MAG TPA: hypothetical protein VND23_03045 [Acidimicrobiales bacterium]|nr:hypothetical protein [Acidimicrobiales bacterium]
MPTSTTQNLLGNSRRLARQPSQATTTTTTTLPPVTSTGTPTAPSPTTLPAATTTTTAPARPSTPAVASSAYYLVEDNGDVHPYGGAVYFGSTASTHVPAPIVGAAPTADGAGYWLATARGGVYRFGDARFYGSAVHKRTARPIVAIASTPDGQGYWLVSNSGAVYNFGDAAYCGSTARLALRNSVVAFATTPDGQGYWIVTAKGAVYAFGDAVFAGSVPLAHLKLRAAVVGVASTADGRGYWLVAANGSVYNFGDARFYGSAVHVSFPKTAPHPVVSITSTSDGAGYWLAASSGRVFDFGDARFSGSLARSQPRPPLAVVGLVRTVPAGATAATSPFPHGTFGVDISNFQCARGRASSIQSDVPATSAIAVLQVAGWLDSSENSCLGSQAAWAVRAAGTGAGASHYSLYLFMNSPGTNAAATAQSADGPAGACAALAPSGQPQCRAYNYGYNGAKGALAYASETGVTSNVWWLDVENDHLSSTANSAFPASYWSASTALNDATIQGADDALRSAAITVGIYSTSVQFPRIAGSFVPSGPRVPLWVAGVPWTNPPFTERGLDSPRVLAAWCAGTAVYAGTRSAAAFAGGVPWLLQETPGNEPSPHGLDPDYAC